MEDGVARIGGTKEALVKRLSLTSIGIAAGVLFFAHALVPDSNAWPIIWPAAAGGVAVYRRSRESHGFFKGIGAAIRTGTIAGLVFVIATAAALALLGTSAFAPLSQALGATGPIVLNEMVLVSLAVAAGVGIAGAALVGVAAYPVTRRLVT